jgi:hypothetical protein
LAKERELKYEIDEIGCWNVTSHGVTVNGYPVFNRDGKKWRIHRYMYQLHTGDIELDGFVIRHKCDNRKCINPEHLEKGTPQQNIQDRVDRGRNATGENHGLSKLTDEQAKFILLDTYYSTAELSRLFNVYPNVIKQIKQRITWRHIV